MGKDLYVWKVEVYGYYSVRGDIRSGFIPELAKIFTSKLSSINYAFNIENKKDRIGDYYRTRITKWYGD